MSDNSTRRTFLKLSSSAAIVGLAGCSGGGSEESTEEMMDESTEEMMDGESTEMMDEESTEGMMTAATFTVRIENVAPTDFYGPESSTGGGIWITPGAYAVHADENPVFTPGESASIGLEALAEAGPPPGFEGETGLVSELESADSVAHAGAYTPENTVADPNDPMGEVPGAPPIAPGGAFEFEVEAEPGQHLSFASMFVPSNDLFFSPETAISLFEDGTPVEGNVTETVELWDAGTEPNQEPGVGADQAPAQESAQQGADEDGVVRLLADVDDGYDYPDVSDAIRVTVTPQ